MLFCFKKFSLNLVHKYTCVWRHKSGNNGSTQNLFLDLSIKFKVVVFKTSSITLLRLSVEMFLFSWLSSTFLTASRPASWGVKGYRPTTSAVTILASCEIWSIFFSFLIKSPESFMYDQPSYITHLSSLSKNPETFSFSSTTVWSHWPSWLLFRLRLLAQVFWNIIAKEPHSQFSFSNWILQNRFSVLGYYFYSKSEQSLTPPQEYLFQ